MILITMLLPAAIVTYLGVWLLTPGLMRLNRDGRLTAANHRGERLPTAVGLALLPAAVVGVWLTGDIAAADVIIVVAVLTVAGLLDDVVGGGRERGIAGHLSAARGGRLTAGTFRIIFAVSAALFVSVVRGAPWPELIIDFGLILVAANFINLFDTGPGRAGKVFLAAGGILAGLGSAVIWPFLGGVLALLPYDLREEAMLGNAGAILLGGALGVGAVWALAVPARYLAFAVFLAAHVVVEAGVSLSAFIPKVEVLRLLDELGRS